MVVMITIMVGISVVMYRYVIHFDPTPLGATIIPLENIDLDAYEKLKQK